MQKINIKIPDNLTEKEEIFAIAKQLSKKQLANEKDKQKLIGTDVKIKHLETQITVTRTTTEKQIVTKVCNCCGTEFDTRTGKKVFHNYGGSNKHFLVCSIVCQKEVIELLGTTQRVSKKSETLSPSFDHWRKN